MKKLMVAACAIAFAAVTHAAQFDWSYDSEGEFNDGATVYVFGGASDIGTTLASILSTQGISEFTTAIADMNYGTDTLTNGMGMGFTEAANGDYATVFVFQDGVTGGKDFAYYAGVDVSDYIYNPPSGVSVLELWGSDSYETGTIKGSTPPGPTPMPEPTSGLLMLIGMGALALRRRRA